MQKVTLGHTCRHRQGAGSPTSKPRFSVLDCAHCEGRACREKTGQEAKPWSWRRGDGVSEEMG